MLRLITSSLCVYCRRGPMIPTLHRARPCSSLTQKENQATVDALYSLSVDIRKVRKLKGWVLHQSPAYVSEAVTLLRGLGAEGSAIASILEQHPEAVLCSPEQMDAQRELWGSVCPNDRDLVGIIEKFPASFFTSACHHNNQRDNILFFQSLRLNKRIISKLMASAPQSFSRPVEHNQHMVHTLQEAYLSLGGQQDNMKIWMQKLLSQNPYVLLKSPEGLRENLLFLRDQGFTSAQLLQLLAKLRGFVTELSPESMRLTLDFSRETLGCDQAQLLEIVLKCPALLYYSVPVLSERLQVLLSAGVSLEQIAEVPTVLELTTQIVSYRIERLKAYGYDVRTGSLEALNGTKKDFEAGYGRLQLRRERPIFNPVAPLKTEE
ncbi:LOW QUALITY PROTEIN: transcription termination factor 2, mitochondrial [Clupea harengus]|uniref:LOW QUALITY PROTEIN: transcription termination factor 2, mitochondrial n=1 Tax=Clupea harengus TaxID=7950 RepID=A0A6P8F8U5_CLUHA|nr:LOW QUALITY PROTEIN: transcription termination factor 2, mitochondrial [Clupea harengus]